MVLPLSDEDKPKCFLCHESYENYEELRNEIKELGDKLKEHKQRIQKK